MLGLDQVTQHYKISIFAMISIPSTSHPILNIDVPVSHTYTHKSRHMTAMSNVFLFGSYSHILLVMFFPVTATTLLVSAWPHTHLSHGCFLSTYLRHRFLYCKACISLEYSVIQFEKLLRSFLQRFGDPLLCGCGFVKGKLRIICSSLCFVAENIESFLNFQKD